jgi:hypothetical protein
MFAQIVQLQWKVSRWLLLPFTLLAIGLPLLALQMMRRGMENSDMFAASDAVGLMAVWTPLYPLLALITGFAVAMSAWVWDHRGNHVYALSLPLARWEYVLLKLAAGAIVLMVPVVALWLAAFIGTSMTAIPDGVHAYPGAFAGRFLLAALIAYTAAFALGAGTVKTTIYIVVGIVLFVIFGTLLVGMIEDMFGVSGLITPIDILHAALLKWPGPFHVYGGNWMLIDV